MQSPTDAYSYTRSAPMCHRTAGHPTTDSVETPVFDRLARLTTRWPKAIIAVTVMFIGLSLAYGLTVTQDLQTGGSTNPASQSSHAEATLDKKFAAGQPNLVLLVTAPQGVDAPDVVAEGQALEAQLAAQHQVIGVGSYWSTHSPLLKAKDGKSAQIIGFIQGSENNQRDFLEKFAPTVDGVQGPVTVQLGGNAVVNKIETEMVRHDISSAEAIGIPLTALVLNLLFRSFIAAALPLLVGAFALIGTNAVLRGITNFAD